MIEAAVDNCLPTRADLTRLSPAAELQHLAAGGRTVRLIPDQPSPWTPARLGFRWQWDIRARPGRGLPVHQCHLDHGPPDRTLLAQPIRSTYDQEPTW